MSKKIPMIKTSLPYVGVARSMILVDPLEKGEMPHYTRDIASKSYSIPKRGLIPEQIIEPESLFIPTFEIASAPRIKKNELDVAPYDIEERMEVRSRDSILRQEDIEFFKVINAAVPTDHSFSVSGSIQPENLLLAMTLLQEHQLPLGCIVLHVNQINKMRMWLLDETLKNLNFKLNPPNYVIATGRGGVFNHTPIIATTMCPKNAIFVLSKPEFIGVMPIRHEVEVTDFKDENRIRSGKTLIENVGFGVLNDYAIARIVLDGFHNLEEKERKYYLDRIDELKKTIKEMKESNDSKEADKKDG